MPLRPAIYFEYISTFKRWPKLHPPERWADKIWHNKLYDRDPNTAQLTDKITSKEHVAATLGTEFIFPTLWAGDVLPPRQQRNWCIPYVIKASHASGWNYFVLSEGDEDWERIETITGKWLQSTYGREAREWYYSPLKPRILVEPFMGAGAVAPLDYKLWVFAGKTKFIQVDTGRLQEHRQYFYDLDWKRLPISFLCPYEPGEVACPGCLDQMVAAAERLAAPFRFVRMDFYEHLGKPIFGEFTFHPLSGFVEFKPDLLNFELARLWPDRS